MAWNQYTGLIPGTVNRLGKKDRTMRRLESSVGSSAKDGPFDRVKLGVKEDSSPKVLEGLEKGSLRGIVLDVINGTMENNDGNVVVNYYTLGSTVSPGIGGGEGSTTRQDFVKVRVWCPELHQCLTTPFFIRKYVLNNEEGNSIPLTDEEKYIDLQIQRSYPVCTAKLSDIGGIIPLKGDLVKVSFTSKDFDEGILEEVMESFGDIFGSVNSLDTNSARNSFEESQSQAQDVNPILRYTTTSIAAQRIFDSLPPGGTGGPSNSELVVLTNTGKPAIKNLALKSFIQMLLDFSEENPGVSLKVNSAYRDLLSDYTSKSPTVATSNATDEEMNNFQFWNGRNFVSAKNKITEWKNIGRNNYSKILSSSQKSLRIKNCFPIEYMDPGTTLSDWKDLSTRTRERIFDRSPPEVQESVLYKSRGCHPQTAPIDVTASKNSAHSRGLAFDIQVYTSQTDRRKFPKDARAKVSISPQYKWLVENCWKYGFKRTVTSERWHFEFREGSRFYSGALVRGHPTFDGAGAKTT